MFAAPSATFNFVVFHSFAIWTILQGFPRWTLILSSLCTWTGFQWAKVPVQWRWLAASTIWSWRDLQTQLLRSLSKKRTHLLFRKVYCKKIMQHSTKFFVLKQKCFTYNFSINVFSLCLQDSLGIQCHFFHGKDTLISSAYK